MTRGEALSLLGLSGSATKEQIRLAYRDHVMAWHPDRFEEAEQKARAEEKLKLINAAYEVLKTYERHQSASGSPDAGTSEQQSGRSSSAVPGALCPKCKRWFRYLHGGSGGLVTCPDCFYTFSPGPDAAGSKGGTDSDPYESRVWQPPEQSAQTYREPSKSPRTTSDEGCGDSMTGAFYGAAIGLLFAGVGAVPGAIIGAIVGGRALMQWVGSVLTTLLTCGCLIAIIAIIGLIASQVKGH